MASSQDFKSHIIRAFYSDIHRIEPDNYAPERYSYDGVDRSQTFDVARHAQYMDWFNTNVDRLFSAYLKLEDDESRNIFINIIRYKLAGHLHVRINSLGEKSKPAALNFKSTIQGVPSKLPSAGMFGNLVHYDFTWNGQHYVVDTLKDGLVWTLVNQQYFFERNGVRVAPEPNDHVIDGGACTGETSIVFSVAVGPAGKVYAFDPVENHLEILRENFSRPSYENVKLFGYGVSDKRVEAPPIVLTTYDPGFRVERGPVPLARIDDLVMNGEIDRVDFIKLDVEGSELASLQGALASIHHYRPKLAISIYHRPEDFYQIIDWVAALDLGYRLYLEHHTIWDEETVLYAMPATRAIS